MQRLEEWLRANGGHISEDVLVSCAPLCALEAEEGEAARGAFEAADRGAFAGSGGLQPGADVCRLPVRLLITEAGVREQLPYGQALQEASEQIEPGSSGLLLLAALLLSEGALQCSRRACAVSSTASEILAPSTSFHAAYYEALPADLSHLPVMWPPGDKLHDLLRGTRLERLLKAKRHLLGLEFALLQSLAPTLQASWEDFLWARATVSNRAYALKIGGTLQRCLVPWADLLNHGTCDSATVHYTFVDGVSAYFLMRSGDAGAGSASEVLQSYGDKSNAALLLDYGFALRARPEAAAATLYISLKGEGRPGVPLGDSAADARSRLLRAARRSGGARLDLACGNPGDLLPLLRAMVAEESELEGTVQDGARPLPLPTEHACTCRTAASRSQTHSGTELDWNAVAQSLGASKFST